MKELNVKLNKDEIAIIIDLLEYKEESLDDQIGDLEGYEEYEEYEEDVKLLSNNLEETRKMLEKFNKLWEEIK
jgi:hypothetical protein